MKGWGMSHDPPPSAIAQRYSFSLRLRASAVISEFILHPSSLYSSTAEAQRYIFSLRSASAVISEFILHPSFFILPLQHRLAGRQHLVGPADGRGVRGLVQRFGRLFRESEQRASANASNVALLSVSVGSIIIASRTISGK